MKPIPSLLFAVLGLAAVAATPASAQEVKGDAQAGQNKVAMCIGCHGITGYKTAFPEVYMVPKIAGQNPGYMVSALKEYAADNRKHPSMRGIAATLGAQDMADVAAYYAALGKRANAELPAPAQPSAQVAELLKKGSCASCHGENFSKPIDPSYPKLAGQHHDYLYVALKSYKDNSNATWGRGNPIMAAQVKQFSNAELKAIARYIGSLPGQIDTVSESRFR